MKREIYEYYKKVINGVTGPMTQSNFQKTGKLTPSEFVEAGDNLIKQFPFWNWMNSSVDYNDGMPPNKKYLVLSNCYSHERAPDLTLTNDCEIDQDGWMITKENIKKVDTSSVVSSKKDSDLGGWESEEDDFGDFDDSIVFKDENQKNRRIYNLTVIYDKYYSAPRMYLTGYRDHSQPLSKDEMMEDVLSENREKTVTVDIHPYLNIPTMSIHPCRHAETMQRIIERMESRFHEECEELGDDIDDIDPIFVFPHTESLFVFLKFIASIIPTIQYDVSNNVDM